MIHFNILIFLLVNQLVKKKHNIKASKSLKEDFLIQNLVNLCYDAQHK